MSKINFKLRTVYICDNYDLLKAMNDETVDLIYLDPPFNKNKDFVAPINSQAAGARFRDIFTKESIEGLDIKQVLSTYPELYEYLLFTKNCCDRHSYCYLLYMSVRLVEMRRILKDTGFIFFHCDHTMSHRIKQVMDLIFGEKCFRNDIVWHYGGTGNPKRKMPAKHDNILFYGKSEKTKIKRIEVPAARKSGWTKKMTKACDDVWSDIKTVYQSDQRGTMTNYPTEKPIRLLQRIIKMATEEGDIVFDPFCGCTTTLITAEIERRKWVGCDISEEAGKLIEQRLNQEKELLQNQHVSTQFFVEYNNLPTYNHVPKKEMKNIYIISHPQFPGEYAIGKASHKSRIGAYKTSVPDRMHKYELFKATEYADEIEKQILTDFKDTRNHEWIETDLKKLKDRVNELIAMFKTNGGKGKSKKK